MTAEFRYVTNRFDEVTAPETFGDSVLTSATAVIGLGYVGLPPVVEFAKHGRTIGHDIARKLVPGGAFIDEMAAFDAAALQDAGYRVGRL